MKLVDNYQAKLEIWAREGKVYPLPKFRGVPVFGAKRFNSYEELNEWKRKLIEEIAAMGGIEWIT